MRHREPYNPLLKSYPDSEKVNAVSLGAETLFTRLIAKGDDAGRYYADPGIVLGKLYTVRMCRGAVGKPEIEKWIAELRDQRLITVYWVNGKRYLEVVNPRRVLRSDVRPDIQFPSPSDENARIESVGSNDTAHGEVAFGGTAQEKPEPIDTAQVTPSGVVPSGTPEKSDTIPRRKRDGTGTIPIGLYPTQPNPTHGNRSTDSVSTAAAADTDAGESGPDVRGKTELPPGFVRFWAAWPKHFRKQGRSKCLTHWRRHKLEKIADDVVQAVERAKRSHDWLKQGGEYIPLPMTWLHRTPWETDPEELDQSPGTAQTKDDLMLEQAFGSGGCKP